MPFDLHHIIFKPDIKSACICYYGNSDENSPGIEPRTLRLRSLTNSPWVRLVITSVRDTYIPQYIRYVVRMWYLLLQEVQ